MLTSENDGIFIFLYGRYSNMTLTTIFSKECKLTQNNFTDQNIHIWHFVPAKSYRYACWVIFIAHLVEEFLPEFQIFFSSKKRVETYKQPEQTSQI